MMGHNTTHIPHTPHTELTYRNPYSIESAGNIAVSLVPSIAYR